VTDYGGKKSSGDSGKDDKPATESKESGKDSASKDSAGKDPDQKRRRPKIGKVRKIREVWQEK